MSFQDLVCRDRAICGSLFRYFRNKLSRSTDRHDPKDSQENPSRWQSLPEFGKEVARMLSLPGKWKDAMSLMRVQKYSYFKQFVPNIVIKKMEEIGGANTVAPAHTPPQGVLPSAQTSPHQKPPHDKKTSAGQARVDVYFRGDTAF